MSSWMRVLAWPLETLVRAYQMLLRPLMPPLCRFYPSCSDYALEALRTHGPVTGSYLAVHRVCRCHPWNPGGVDLVPPRLPRHTSSPPPTSTPTSTT